MPTENEITTQDSKQFCSDISLQADEPLYGTATQTRVYLLLEHNSIFAAKAIQASSLSSAVKARLTSFTDRDKTTKALLIRRRQALSEPRMRFFIALANERDPVLYEFILGAYEQLLALDIAAILEGDQQYWAYRRTAPLVLVCTNGRRDACCARKGIPVFDALYQAANDESQTGVWQSSHVGGHRYAANLIFLPHGLLYGRVDPLSAPKILHAYQNGQLYPENLRGRTCYSEPAQVADYYLRQQSQALGLEDFHLLDERQVDPNQWEVRFTHAQSGRVHQLRIASEKSDVVVFSGCALDKSSPFTWHRLLDYHISEDEAQVNDRNG
jgi:hypothetical protein